MNVSKRLVFQIDATSPETIPMAKLADYMADFAALLAKDDAAGSIIAENDSGAAELLNFPGRSDTKEPVYGPFTQEGHLDGLLISIGGSEETVHLRLQDGETIHTRCETTRAIARDLGKHLFESVRLHGDGRWTRSDDGRWKLIHFQVHRFDVLDPASLRQVVSRLRAVPGNGWNDLADPLGELDKLRHGEAELQ